MNDRPREARAFIQWRPPVISEQPSPNHSALRQDRIGVMLHYDGSASDVGGLGWFKHPDCRVSYNFVVGDQGEITYLVEMDQRAWHAGVCKQAVGTLPYTDANSAFVGIAALTNEHTDVTQVQTLSIAWLCRWVFAFYGWSVADVDRRITSHRAEAWPRGRKSDPEGKVAGNPILSTQDVRDLVSRMGAPEGMDNLIGGVV